jgi:hypothetical protein
MNVYVVQSEEKGILYHGEAPFLAIMVFRDRDTAQANADAMDRPSVVYRVSAATVAERLRERGEARVVFVLGDDEFYSTSLDSFEKMAEDVGANMPDIEELKEAAAERFIDGLLEEGLLEFDPATGEYRRTEKGGE